MAVYYKPQSPIQSGEDFIYPITTADQIMKSDNSRRLEQAGLIVADNSTSLGGVAAKDYARKTDTAPDSSKLGGKTLAEIMLALYPVGSIYLSVNNTSPASLFGGEWTQINGRFLIGTGAPELNDDGTSPGSYNFSAGSTGGEATHTLTVDEIPPHRHKMKAESTSGSLDYVLTDLKGHTKEYQNYRDLPYLDYTGGGAAHNNMPPYLAVYMWKRVS